jgi:hypothetical protein
MHPIQVVLVLFSLFAISRVVPRIRSRTLRPIEGAVWIIVWAGVAAVALVPAVAQWVANLAGVGRGADFVVYITLAALVYTAFRVRLTIRGLERQITELVRALALERARKPDR